MNPASTEPSPGQPVSRRDFLRRGATVAAVATGIVGATLVIGERQGFGDIGKGGINASLLPKVGEPAPDLLTFTAGGDLIQLQALRGTPVWLNFWGSWCQPCRSEMPEIEQAWRTLGPQGLVLLGISQREEPSTAQAYADLVGATFPILADPQMLRSLVPQDRLQQVEELLASWQIQNFPTHVFIDREGIVRAVVLTQMTYQMAVEHGQQILDSPLPGGMPVASPASAPVSPIASPSPGT